MSLDDETRALDRRELAGEDVSRERERLRRRQLGPLDSAILRLCMAAKAAWGVNLNRRDRVQITRVLVGASNDRASCSWANGHTVTRDHDLNLRGERVRAATIADVGSVHFVLHRRGNKRRPTSVIFTQATVDALAARYPTLLVENLGNGVRITSASEIAEDMRQAIERMRAFQDADATILRRGLRQEFFDAYQRSIDAIGERFRELRFRPIEENDRLAANMKLLEELGASMSRGFEQRISDAVFCSVPNLIRIAPSPADARSPAPPSPAPGSGP